MKILQIERKILERWEAKRMRSIDEHRKQVHKIQDVLKSSYKKKEPLTLKKSFLSSNTTRNATYKRETSSIDLSDLNCILELNLNENYVIVEPQITIRKLTSYLLKFNYSLPVTPEFETITIGGAVMGAALESSSYKWGQFNDSCLEIDLLTGDGSLMTLSPTSYPEIFYGISGSYGSLGLISRVKLKIIPVEKFVKVTYTTFNTFNEALSYIEKTIQEKSVDYLDGVVFNQEQYVIMTAVHCKETQKPFYKPTYFSKWFYEHIFEASSKQESFTEWMELSYFLFRFDKGAFWMGRYIQKPSIFLRLLTKFRLNSIEKTIREELKKLPKDKFPSKFFHLCFNWALSSHNLYRFWHRVPEKIAGTLFLVHDFYVPLSKAHTVIERFSAKTGIYPIWLCPIKAASTPQILSPHYIKNGDDLYFINMGFYGMPNSPLSIPELSHELEMEILHYKGRKMLYSLTYYTEEELKEIFDDSRYQELRRLVKADGVFLSLEKKICS